MSGADDFFGQEEASGGQFDLGQVFGFLGRHRWWIAGVTAAALLPALFVPTLPDDIYQASARVTVQARPDAMRVGADVMPTGQAQWGTNPLTRERLVALSDFVLGKVVDGFPDEHPRAQTLLDLVMRWIPTFGEQRSPYTPEQIRKARVEGIKRALTIELGASGDILDVIATGVDPQSATFLANSVADAIVAFNSDEQSESYERTVSWLNTQVVELRERVSSNQTQLGKHVAKHGLVTEQPQKEGSAPSGRAAMLDDLSRSEIELQTVRARMHELPVQPSGPNGETAQYDPELLRVQQRYDTARAALEEARLTYTPTHPEVRRREAVTRSIEKELESWGPQVPLTSVNAADQAEYRSLVQQEAGLRARTAALRRRVEEMSDSTTEKTRALGEYERLDRQLTLDRDMLDLLMRKREEVVLAAAADYTRARVLDRAIPPLVPVGPNRVRILLVGLALAFGSGLGAAAVREFLDQTLRDPDEARRLFGAPVIAMVPFVRDSDVAPERHSQGSPSSLPAESYRNLRTALLFSSASQGFTTIVVTSGLAGEGKTTVSVNLASSFAQVGRSVLLIDADMRRPRVHRVFGIGAAPGLAEVLRGDSTLDAAVRRPGEGPFDVLSAGQQPSNPSELLASPQFSMLLSRVRTQYDLVIIDSPVLLGVSDTHVLTSQADATLLVQRPGSLQKRGAREVRQALLQSGARVLGVVFNQVPRSDRQFYPAYLESPYLSGFREKQASEG